MTAETVGASTPLEEWRTHITARALEHARHQLPVFVLHGVRLTDGLCTCGNPKCDDIGKHPRHGGWQRSASTDPAAVSAMFSSEKRETNVAIATGTVLPTGDALVAIDIDTDAADGTDGAAELEALEAEHGYLPATWTVRTQRGRHFYFRVSGAAIRNSVGQLRKGIDVRGKGGYVVAPGSKHRLGFIYCWEVGRSPEDLEIAIMPDWLVAMLMALQQPRSRSVGCPPNGRESKHAPPNGHGSGASSNPAARSARGEARARAYFKKAIADEARELANTPEHFRNKRLVKAAYSLAGYFWAGLDRDEARRALELAAERAGLEPGETQRTIASGFKGGEAEPRPVPDFEADAYAPDAESIPANDNDGKAETQVPLWGGLPAGCDPLSDLGNAHRYVAVYSAIARHDASLGWVVYDGRVWQRSESRARALACDLARQFMFAATCEAARLKDAGAEKEAIKAAKALEEFARRSQSRKAIEAMLALACALPPIACETGVWDRDPWLLNVANGTIELRSGVLRAHRADDMLTKVSPVAFDAEAKAPTWERFQKEIHPDVAIREFNQRHYGSCLTGVTRDHVVIVAHGGGRNGKTVEHQTVRAVLGDYACEAAGGTFILRIQNGRSTDYKLARLRGARLVTTSESSSGDKLDEELIKRVSGGEHVTANHMYHETFEYTPAFKLRLITNHRPKVDGVDPAIWSRLRLVKYGQSFEGREDRELLDKLLADLPGVLNWLLAGVAAWQRSGLQAPSTVEASTNEWRNEANHVAPFVNECCEKCPGKTKTSLLHEVFLLWAIEGGRDLEGTGLHVCQVFSRRLGDLGYEEDRTGKARFRVGIKLKPDWESRRVPAEPAEPTGDDA